MEIVKLLKEMNEYISNCAYFDTNVLVKLFTKAHSIKFSYLTSEDNYKEIERSIKPEGMEVLDQLHNKLKLLVLCDVSLNHADELDKISKPYQRWDIFLEIVTDSIFNLDDDDYELQSTLFKTKGRMLVLYILSLMQQK